MELVDIVILLFLAVIFIYCLCVNKEMKEKNACIKGKTHDWVFQCNSKGTTGDLGFGIKNSWNINHYRCSKCGKHKEEEL